LDALIIGEQGGRPTAIANFAADTSMAGRLPILLNQKKKKKKKMRYKKCRMKCHVVDQSSSKRKEAKYEKVRSISTPGKRSRESNQSSTMKSWRRNSSFRRLYIKYFNFFYCHTLVSHILCMQYS
jgi:hypothetical protein